MCLMCNYIRTTAKETDSITSKATFVYLLDYISPSDISKCGNHNIKLWDEFFSKTKCGTVILYDYTTFDCHLQIFCLVVRSGYHGIQSGSLSTSPGSQIFTQI